MPYKNPQDQKEYYNKNKDELKKKSRLNYLNNREDRMEKCKEYYERTKQLTGEGSGHGRGKNFQKGNIPWNKGKKGLQIAWNKGKPAIWAIGKAYMKGKIPWNKGKKSLLNREDHWNWKGGITPINETIRKSVEYSLWRKSCFERDNFTCQFSGQSGGDIQVHHINNFADFPELRTTISNGITMTKKIHKLFHKNYGVKNNTPEQLEEFSEDLLFKPSNDWMVHA